MQISITSSSLAKSIMSCDMEAGKLYVHATDSKYFYIWDNYAENEVLIAINTATNTLYAIKDKSRTLFMVRESTANINISIQG